MFQSALLWFCFAFSPIPVCVWFVSSMFPVFLLLSLYSPFQLVKATCVNETTVCVSRNDDDGSTEGVVDSEDSSSSTDEYDVFLSFRGPDTRQGFTDVLYDTMKRSGIRVFRDDDEVSIGQPLRKILHAIEMSQICVPIFSRTFASSSWCLLEVAKMMELKKAVMPIFYDVTPDDVKLKTEAYRKDLKMHEKKHGKEQVKVWEDALRKVSRIKGKEVFNTRYTEFCKKLVDEGLSVLKPRRRSYDGCLVGIDSQIKSLTKLMDMESHNVQYIGIHGMGGIGKTTLAKYLFETLSDSFDSFWFLEEVRESSLKCNGLQDLQKQLQAGLDSEFSRGCNSLRDIKERFRTKKVLIVLDDVDKLEQIEKLAGHSSWFGSGSRIIVTTRNVDVLKKYGKLDQNEEVQFFEMMTLEHERALELFQRYAFRGEKPPSILETISREIVSTARGLPLALKLMGSRLYNIKDERVWIDVLERSREVQDRDVMGRLRISYDALEDDQKKIFLDIACVPDMNNKRKAMYMWEASKLYPHLNLAVLGSISLVKLIGNSIMMHDLLRDLGKNIDREQCIKLLGKSTRVCKKDEALNVLLRKEGKENIEILCVDESLGMSLTNEHLESFHKLRLLKLVGTNLEGDFNNFLLNLAWFTWCYCPPILKATNLCMKNLVVLNLSHGLFSESWDSWSIIQNLNNLKDLDLSYCHNLTSTPDFSEINHLERLTLSGCSELRELHSSVGKLKRLKYLNLRNCYSLDELPDEIGRLENLEKLQASGSYHRRQLFITFKLPETVYYLKSLVALELIDLDIQDIPDSIGGLGKLKRVFLHTSAEVLPESLGDLKLLGDLELNAKGISKLPNSLGRLVKLESLRLWGCSNLEELPELLGSLHELRFLLVEDANKIRKIPVSIGKLKKLQVFEFTSIGGGMLEELPTELFRLSSKLKSFTLKGSSISTLPFTINQLPDLQHLYLVDNHQLEELPDLPVSLRYLCVSFTSLQRFPDLSRLVNLLEFSVNKMDDYRWPQRLPSSKVEGIENLTIVQELGLGVPSASTLSQFNMDSLTQLNNHKIDFQPNTASVSLLPSLDILEDNSQSSMLGLNFSDLSNLKYLTTLRLKNFLIEDERVERLGIQHLGNVTRVSIFNCGVKLIEQIYLMKNLKDLSVYDCGSLRTFPNLAKLKSLAIYSCKELVEIPGLGNVESLVSLCINDCGSLERLENLSKLEKLSSMRLSICPKLRIIEGADRCSFDLLDINYCRSVQNVEELKKRSKRGSIDGLEFENLG